MTAVSPKVWVIDSKDNAGTVIGGDIAGAMQVPIVGGVGGAGGTLAVRQAVPYGHKVALIDMAAGADVIKYGVVIGRLARGVQRGDHVHVHNLESLRGRGDLDERASAA